MGLLSVALLCMFLPWIANFLPLKYWDCTKLRCTMCEHTSHFPVRVYKSQWYATGNQVCPGEEVGQGGIAGSQVIVFSEGFLWMLQPGIIGANIKYSASGFSFLFFPFRFYKSHRILVFEFIQLLLWLLIVIAWHGESLTNLFYRLLKILVLWGVHS